MSSEGETNLGLSKEPVNVEFRSPRCRFHFIHLLIPNFGFEFDDATLIDGAGYEIDIWVI